MLVQARNRGNGEFVRYNQRSSVGHGRSPCRSATGSAINVKSGTVKLPNETKNVFPSSRCLLPSDGATNGEERAVLQLAKANSEEIRKAADDCFETAGAIARDPLHQVKTSSKSPVRYSLASPDRNTIALAATVPHRSDEPCHGTSVITAPSGDQINLAG